MTEETEALQVLTDMALFIAVFVAVLSTVYAVGEPVTKGEVMGRAIALWMCAVTGALLVVWLFAALLIRVGVLSAVH